MVSSCPKCGTSVSQSAEFCPACGAPTYSSGPVKTAVPVDAHKREHVHTAEYWLNIKCDNCNHTDRISIPLGTPANSYKCPNCQCVGFLHKVLDAQS
jgi:hypothetical protein